LTGLKLEAKKVNTVGTIEITSIIGNNPVD